jgi:hypothetical protein
MAVSLLLSAGLFCSQICDVTCNIRGCVPAVPAPASAKRHPPHCPFHDSKSVPQKPEQKPPCRGHVDLAAPSIAAGPPVENPSADGFVAEAANLAGVLYLVSPEHHLNGLRGKPDRSPPIHSVLRI